MANGNVPRNKPLSKPPLTNMRALYLCKGFFFSLNILGTIKPAPLVPFWPMGTKSVLYCVALLCCVYAPYKIMLIHPFQPLIQNIQYNNGITI